MREKFKKYWGECNLVMAIAAVLDPLYKMKLIEFCFPKIYSSIEAGRHITVVREALYALFYEYVNATSFADSAMTSSSYNHDLVAVSGVSKSVAEFDEWATIIDSIEPIKSDLDVYLEEGRLINKGNTNSVKFDALEWWKTNTLKFRILSDMARDILSIPISTVASESAFSAGGRVLNKCRSCLKLETVQALICTGDWIRSELGIEKLEENDDEDIKEVCFE